MAVPGAERLLRHLEAHPAAHAVPAIGRPGHDDTITTVRSTDVTVSGR
jgi:hypothetical protein